MPSRIEHFVPPNPHLLSTLELGMCQTYNRMEPLVTVPMEKGRETPLKASLGARSTRAAGTSRRYEDLTSFTVSVLCTGFMRIALLKGV